MCCVLIDRRFLDADPPWKDGVCENRDGARRGRPHWSHLLRRTKESLYTTTSPQSETKYAPSLSPGEKEQHQGAIVRQIHVPGRELGHMAEFGGHSLLAPPPGTITAATSAKVKVDRSACHDPPEFPVTKIRPRHPHPTGPPRTAPQRKRLPRAHIVRRSPCGRGCASPSPRACLVCLRSFAARPDLADDTPSGLPSAPTSSRAPSRSRLVFVWQRGDGTCSTAPPPQGSKKEKEMGGSQLSRSPAQEATWNLRVRLQNGDRTALIIRAGSEAVVP